MKQQQNGLAQNDKLVFEYVPRPKRGSNSQTLREAAVKSNHADDAPTNE